LNAVIGYSEMMAGGMAGELSEKQIGYADKISKSGRHLLDIINDLLDLTNMDAGRLKLNYETVYISPLFNTLQDALTPLATEQQITLVFTSQNCPQSIVGDNERVNQILNKLITNAIKFNKAGGEVRVRALGETDWIRFEVEDNGVGIPAQEVEQLFTAFYQVDSSSTRLHEGTGLGLALTKRLVELQGGTIAVESQEGKGSKFIVRLPVSPA
jgi:signal transduction histidine kinase